MGLTDIPLGDHPFFTNIAHSFAISLYMPILFSIGFSIYSSIYNITGFQYEMIMFWGIVTSILSGVFYFIIKVNFMYWLENLQHIIKRK